MKADAKPTFTEVARIIANGNPPDWLVPALEHFAGFIGSKRLSNKEYDQGLRDMEKMHWAAGFLIKKLEKMFAGVSSPDATTAIKVLRKIKHLNRPLPYKAGGHRPYPERLTCAAVVVEAWKLIHGNVEPQSIEVLSSCADYWQACGGAERDARNWRRDTDHRVAEPDQFVQQVLAAYLAAYAHN